LLFSAMTLQANTTVRFTLPYGSIDVELYDDHKPITVTNFLSYVDRGEYTNMFMHRWDDGFVLQGGGFAVRPRQGTTPEIVPIPTHGTILNEYSVGPRYSNTYGTIAMARSSATNSATSQFFFNLGDNSFLDSVNGGFTVFGRVIAGFDVLNRFLAFDSVNGPWLGNAGGALNELPLQQPPDVAGYEDLIHTKIEVLRRHQRITFPPVPPMTYADGSFPLVAANSSGLPITFQVVSGPAFITDGRVYITGAGSIVLRASHPGTSLYIPASAEQTVTVTKASQEITFDPIGNQLLSAGSVPLVVTTISRFLPPTLTVLEGPATISNRTAVFTGGLGQVTIRASQPGNTNYHPAPSIDRTFQIYGTVNVTSSEGGTATKTPDFSAYTNLTSVTFTATPEPGFTFTGWTGTTNSAQNPLTLIVTSNINLRAEFRAGLTAPQLTIVDYVPGTFRLQLTAEAGSNYELQRSSNLTNWSTIKTGATTSGQVFLVDEAALADRAFYRVRSTRP